MKNGVTKPEVLIRRLEAIGGQKEYHGGKVKMKFKGTTIRIGRNDFSRPMLARMRRKLRRAGVNLSEMEEAA